MKGSQLAYGVKVWLVSNWFPGIVRGWFRGCLLLYCIWLLTQGKPIQSGIASPHLLLVMPVTLSLWHCNEDRCAINHLLVSPSGGILPSVKVWGQREEDSGSTADISDSNYCIPCFGMIVWLTASACNMTRHMWCVCVCVLFLSIHKCSTNFSKFFQQIVIDYLCLGQGKT